MMVNTTTVFLTIHNIFMLFRFDYIANIMFFNFILQYLDNKTCNIPDMSRSRRNVLPFPDLATE